MRIFSLINLLLVGVVMATHQGAHLDGLLTSAQTNLLNAGAKVMLTGQVDLSTLTSITKIAKENVAAAAPASAAAAPFDFAAESRGGGDAVVVPANYIAPAAVDTGKLDQVVASVLANLNS